MTHIIYTSININMIKSMIYFRRKSSLFSLTIFYLMYFVRKLSQLRSDAVTLSFFKESVLCLTRCKQSLSKISF